GSRLAETASENTTLSGAMSISPAISLAISTSKPSGLPSRFLSPKRGWSNLVPTLTVPASLSLAMVVPSAKLAPWLTSPPPAPPSVGRRPAWGQGQHQGQGGSHQPGCASSPHGSLLAWAVRAARQ